MINLNFFFLNIFVVYICVFFYLSTAAVLHYLSSGKRGVRLTGLVVRTDTAGNEGKYGKKNRNELSNDRVLHIITTVTTGRVVQYKRVFIKPNRPRLAAGASATK